MVYCVVCTVTCTLCGAVQEVQQVQKYNNKVNHRIHSTYNTAGENNIKVLKMRNNFGALSTNAFFQYCDSNIGLFVPHKIIDPPSLR